MTIAAILAGNRHPVITADGAMKVSEAIALLAEKRIGALLVIADGEEVGIFSERDVIYCLQTAGADALNRTVGEVMTAPAVTVGPGEKVYGALSLMTRRRIRHLPCWTRAPSSASSRSAIS